MTETIPLSLYIHIPWCVKKCPYCDFNSYENKDTLPQKAYIETVLRDLDSEKINAQQRPLHSIFFGGGTPSLFSPESIGALLDGVAKQFDLKPNLEVTLEANPGTLEYYDFNDYKKAGINRISLGAQSFDNAKLEALGRIHQANDIKKAIGKIISAGFERFNLDIMYGLPNQTTEEALEDLKIALSFSPPHLSWYHLTLEPNTVFHHQKPPIPKESIIEAIETEGLAYLADQNLNPYEISAFAKPHQKCQHNLNYWTFGDYIGVGAGAHGKITDLKTKTITRYWKTRYPKSYLTPNHVLLAGQKTIPESELPLEFMLNALRLKKGVSLDLFEERTFLRIEKIKPMLQQAEKAGLIRLVDQTIIPTDKGHLFLNDLLMLFH